MLGRLSLFLSLRLQRAHNAVCLPAVRFQMLMAGSWCEGAAGGVEGRGMAIHSRWGGGSLRSLKILHRSKLGAQGRVVLHSNVLRKLNVAAWKYHDILTGSGLINSLCIQLWIKIVEKGKSAHEKAISLLKYVWKNHTGWSQTSLEKSVCLVFFEQTPFFLSGGHKCLFLPNNARANMHIAQGRKDLVSRCARLPDSLPI